MPDASNIKVNNVSYSIKDSTARASIESLEQSQLSVKYEAATETVTFTEGQTGGE